MRNVKKIFYSFLCILLFLSLGIPLLYNKDDKLKAAEYTGEKIIDFDYFLTNSAFNFKGVYKL